VNPMLTGAVAAPQVPQSQSAPAAAAASRPKTLPQSSVYGVVCFVRTLGTHAAQLSLAGKQCTGDTRKQHARLMIRQHVPSRLYCYWPTSGVAWITE
jgi:hypothetical protein